MSGVAATEHAGPTVQAVLAAARRRCADNSAAAGDCALLLALALDVPRTWLLAHGEQRPDAAALARFETLLQRRLAGEPMAYLRGRQGFWSLELDVTPEVLVPRPETELLVELALARMGECGRLADLGTGSGAIALALASARPHWQIVATDRSAAALAVAAGNAARLGSSVEFRHGDWFAPLAGERFDLIVSNPPYIAAHDACLEGDGVRCEPRAALVAGDAGLADLAAIIAGSATHLSPGGGLLLEHGADQAPAVRALLAAWAFDAIATHADLAGRPRVTFGRLPCAN
ncbi:MAG: peptide chain release factor N(5)-glutamine methyltransferase [Immundisolibacter sp.]|uniref:peptide chain release factor N(5)-glutamine methyltransferase n=1 Tax=Immundisolibacter sp. TaxID=1934948 RepID=UPI0019CF05C8|nr:peptide chain release factor N(5)-glutamine methyltransferase [Immundisolibacter sp.]MBC7161599.1 peptide chain release factor N(5)-glutamine methyltransferase [Immundisolibacter sp.]